MDLRALKYFTSVYETGSFSAASRSQFIAQPSISAAIKQLEQSLSQPLFIRLARGVKPTEAGQQLYPLALQLLGQAEAIQELFIEQPFKIPFRLGLIKGLSVDRMSKLLKQFTAAVDAMELTLVPDEEQCDARIINKNLLQTGEKFLPMWQEDYQLAIPVSHSLGLLEQVSLTSLADVPFIQRTPCEGWNMLRDRLQQTGIVLDIRARIQTVEYALGLVKAGLGCAFIPISSEVSSHNDIVFRELSDLKHSRQIGLAYRQDSAILQVLLQVVSP